MHEGEECGNAMNTGVIRPQETYGKDRARGSQKGAGQPSQDGSRQITSHACHNALLLSKWYGNGGSSKCNAFTGARKNDRG